MAMTSSRSTVMVVVMVAVWLLNQAPVLVQAQFQTEPRDAEALLNGLVILQCTLVAPQDATVYWSIPVAPRTLTVGPDRRFVEADAPSRFSLQGQEGTGVYNLVIGQVLAEDAGSYRCNVVLRGRGDIPSELRSTSPATVSVVQVPANGVPACWVEEGRKAQVGDDMSLRCASTDNGVELTWYAEDVALSSTRFQISSTPPAVMGIDTQLLAQASADQQTFTCQPNTDEFPACSVTVEVLHPPVVSIEPSNLLETGADASFTCKATGNPPYFAYTWHYNDYQISFQENPRFNRARLEQSGSVLVLPELAATDDNATLRCEAANSLGATTERHVIRTLPGKTLAQTIGPILLGIILGLVLIVLVIYAWWWRRQRRKVKQISKKKKSMRRAFSLRGGRDDVEETVESGTVYKQAIGGFGSSRYGKTPSVNGDLARSGLDLQSAGYGPDLTSTSGYRATAEVEPEDDGALRPIPRKKSTTSLSSMPNGGARASTTSDDKPLVDPEPDKSFTYYVNPHFDEHRQSMVMAEHKPNDLNPPEYNILDDNNDKKVSNEDAEGGEDILSTEL